MDVPNEALGTNTTTPPNHVRVLKDITFGSIAGMVSKVFEHPFDLTKVRLQSQTWKNEGVSGLYRGLPAPIVGAMAENASLFLSYRELQNLIRRVTHEQESEKLPLHQLALAAAGSGAITSFLLTPIELVKCKMQVQMLVTPASSSLSLPGPISVLVSAFRGSGFTGLWLGHTGTLIRETGGTAAWFSTKEYISSLLLARRTPIDPDPLTLRPWESALSGACAGAAFNLALFPADTVKSAMQTAEELRPSVDPGVRFSRPTFLGTFSELYKAQGIRGLYAGCGITIARSIPSSAIIFLIFDGLDRRFG
ncbi:mitochondrial carrier [Gymnopus androsaceus JB14]|uniref:Mitochondrial carrier n=1 Tax=Gymnopus androsaceus JB14 TaxID=1447944 RepID=A0A6A4GQC7_9AGAR|nr:mitochondrial carrier [Gymnopus androsaceus JB14]